MSFPGGAVVKAMKDALEKEMATHSSILSGWQSMGSQRVGHNWASTSTYFMLYVIWMIFLREASDSQEVKTVWSRCILSTIEAASWDSW